MVLMTTQKDWSVVCVISNEGEFVVDAVGHL